MATRKRATPAQDPLADYAAKRAFDATPEPAAVAVSGREGPLLFVVQLHAARARHFDLRLECGGVLRSWAVPKGVSPDPAEKRLAMATEDHPLEYATFEGVIPQGQYGAGEMIVWDCGTYSPDEGGVTYFHDRERAEREVAAGLEAGKLSFLLRGERLKGSYALVRTKQPGQWLLLKHRDRHVSQQDLAAVHDRSVLSGLALADLRAVPVPRGALARMVPHGPHEKLPAKLAPMLADTADAPSAKAGWSWEPKLDGYRALASVSGGRATLRSRRGIDLTPSFPGLVAELAAQLVEGMVLDGEIVAFDANGRPSFNALQNRVQRKVGSELAQADREVPAVFFAFDLLHFAGLDVRGAHYRERRRWLTQALLPSPLVQLVHAVDDGVALHAAALASGFEGVIGKRVDSRYEAGRRSPAWVKVKAARSAEFVIGGWTKGKGARDALGALLVGWRDADGKLHFASHVGSGFDERTLKQLMQRLAPLKRRTRPFVEQPELNAPATWVEPELVAEVRFQEWTGDGRLRAPVFLRLRDDVDAATVRRGAERIEEVPAKAPARAADPVAQVLAQLDGRDKTLQLDVGGHLIRVTHLDREYWPAHAALKQPALTKRDLLRYVAQVSPYMLPHLADRPLTMIRMPDGIGGQRFFQKHWEQSRPEFVRTITVFSGHKDERHDYLLCNDLPTLLWLAQSGTLEFHVWHSRAKAGADATTKSTDYASSLESLEASLLNRPDYVIFDIDPYIYSGKEAKGAEPELNTVAFEKGKEIAFRLRELLRSMKLDAIVKTSGKTGLHVFVPIRRAIDFDVARHVSELVSGHLMRLNPKDITMDWAVPKRTGKIFMDHNMNVRGKTLNVAYSPRGEPGAPVSMPLTWDELASAHPLDFRIPNAIARLRETGDRWREALTAKQDLRKALGI